MADFEKIIVGIEANTRQFNRALRDAGQRADRFIGGLKRATFAGLAFFGLNEATQLIEKLGETMIRSGGQAGEAAGMMGRAIDRAKRTVVGIAEAIAIQLAPALTGAADFLANRLPRAAALTVNALTKARQYVVAAAASIAGAFGLETLSQNLADQAQAYAEEWERATKQTEEFLFTLGKAVKLESDVTKQKDAQAKAAAKARAASVPKAGEFLEIDPARTAFGVGGSGKMLEEQQTTNSHLAELVRLSQGRQVAVAG